MSDLNKLGIAEARDALKAGDFTSVELTESCLSAIDAASALNAVVHKTPDFALEQAKAADARINSEDAPALCGIPLGIKDLFCTKGIPSQAASAILDGFKPEYESTVTTKLFDAGAVMLGKLNMDEFAMGSSNETSTYGDAVNPWRREGDDTNLTPGGSSGGSASAVAADLCMAATGTDTGGSIRQPAAFTGITGIKPTYGPRVPLGHNRVCLVAGSGRADDEVSSRCGDHAGRDVRPRPRSIPPALTCPSPISKPR